MPASKTVIDVGDSLDSAAEAQAFGEMMADAFGVEAKKVVKKGAPTRIEIGMVVIRQSASGSKDWVVDFAMTDVPLKTMRAIARIVGQIERRRISDEAAKSAQDGKSGPDGQQGDHRRDGKARKAKP